jgi:hypothetical protein
MSNILQRPEAVHIPTEHNGRASSARSRDKHQEDSAHRISPEKEGTNSECTIAQNEYSLERWTPGTYDFSISNSIESFDDEKAIASATVLPLSFSGKIARPEFLEAYAKRHPMPQLVGPRWVLKLRFGFFTVYRRLFAIVFVANIAAIITLASRGTETNSSQAAIGVGSCLFAAVLARFEPLINVVMSAHHLAPLSWPVSMRKRIAKVYSHGGIHSGCGASAAAWYIYLMILLALEPVTGHERLQIGIHFTTAIVFACLIIMIGMSHPRSRSRHHNLWEGSHRYVGWLLTAALLAQVFLFCGATDRSFGSAVVRSTLFWQVMAVVGLLIYPWAVMRTRSYVPTQLASHALRLEFDYCKPKTGHCIRLGTSPLEDWHAFITIPRADGTKGFSVVISNAGDWTWDMITSKHRSSKIWVRGRLYLGVMEVPMLFSPLVIAATGSGIAPCMAFFNTHPGWPVRIVWSARAPEQTYGSQILETVLRADPKAIVINTTQTGRPDMAALVYAAYCVSPAQRACTIRANMDSGDERRGYPVCEYSQGHRSCKIRDGGTQSAIHCTSVRLLRLSYAMGDFS